MNNTALIVFIVTALSGFFMAIAGVFVIWGTGPALLAGSISSFITAGFIRKGMQKGKGG